MFDVYGFTRADATRILKATRQTEAFPLGQRFGQELLHPHAGPNVLFILVTSATLTNGYNPCLWQSYSLGSDSFADGDTILGWVKGLNGAVLVANRVYGAIAQGASTFDGKGVFIAISTYGLTGTREAYRYQCVGTTLKELKATVIFETGLCQSWSAYLG